VSVTSVFTVVKLKNIGQFLNYNWYNNLISHNNDQQNPVQQFYCSVDNLIAAFFIQFSHLKKEEPILKQMSNI